MTTTFERVLATAQAAKQRKQDEYQPLIGNVYRHNEKITSQISISDHSGQIHDPEALGILNVQDSLTTLTTEHNGLKAAGGDGSVYDAPRPLVETPNKYTHLKRCIYCKQWRNRSQFSADKRHVDGLQSRCRVCEGERKRVAYVPKWKRGV